jgi:uracil-DNA glycosylase family 4
LTKKERLIESFGQFTEQFRNKEVVSGCGNVDSGLMLIGEAPGKDEVRLSKPFVGAAGKYLNEFLNFLNIDREDIYITNAIKYRLSKFNPDTGRLSNRPATKEEIDLCRPYLIQEINIIRPTFIVTLGNVPLRAVTGNHSFTIGGMHGHIMNIDISDREHKFFALYHPASLIYNRSLKETYFYDLKLLRDVLSSGT